MIEILNPTELARAKDTGALVAHILQTLKGRTTVGTSLLDIDRWTMAMILEAGAQSCYVDYEPSFGRGPFGHYICTSVNDAVLHGLPHDYTLADGDLLTLDLAVSLGGVAVRLSHQLHRGRVKASGERRDDQRNRTRTERGNSRRRPRGSHRRHLPCHRLGPR